MTQTVTGRPVKSRQPGTPGSSEYSRKDKSLGLLCENTHVKTFVQEFGKQENQRISLDAAATTLGVERRRIYDIVNVLESVGIVIRQAKNCYAWRGFTQIHSKLDDLRTKACSDLYGGPEDFRTPAANRKPNRNKSMRAKCEVPSPSSNDVGDKGVYMSSSLETEPDDLRSTTTVRPTSRKEKSLGVLSQRFVQLFLLAGSAAVSLDSAAVQLLGRSPSDSEPLAVSPAEGDTSKLLKTKVRRLYDIANILSSLNLIEKVHTANRKPAFKWLGPEASSIAVLALQDDGSKRPASVVALDDRARTAVKRRKTFTATNTDICTTTQPGGSAPIAPASVSPVSDLDGFDNEQGFEVDTMNKLHSVINSFPESYAKQWREYVQSVNTMLARGQVSREKAYESVSNVLKQYKHRATPTNDLNCTDSIEQPANGECEQTSDLQSRSAIDQRQDNSTNHGQNTDHSQAALTKSPKRGRDVGREATVDPVQVSNLVNKISSVATNRGSIGRDVDAEPRDKPGGTASKVEIEKGIGTKCGTEKECKAEANAEATTDAEVKRSILADGGSEKKNCVDLAMTEAELRNKSTMANGMSIDGDVVDEGTNCANSSFNSNPGYENDNAVARAAAAAATAAAAVATGSSISTGYGTVTSDRGMMPDGVMWTREGIDQYMRKAREAGPEYHIAAEQWLRDFRKWEKTWAGPIAALSGMNQVTLPTSASVDNQSNQIAGPSCINADDKVVVKE